MNILVTGGLGVNGCWVVRELIEKGHTPIIYDNRSDFTLLPDLSGEINLVVGDVLDFASVIRAVKDNNVDRICHLAAVYPDAADANPLQGFQINAMSTVYMLEAARIMDCDRVVFTSSVGALAPLTEEYLHPTLKPVGEDAPAYPVKAVYSASKVASELMGLNYKNLYNIGFVALRYAAIFGMGKKDPRHGLHNILWIQMVENAMLGIPTIIEKGGDEIMDMTYARDVAHSVVRGVLAEPTPEHHVFHIGSGRRYTVNQFADAVRAAVPGAQIEVGPGRDPRNMGPRAYYVMDITRAKNELGYEPQFTLEEAVKDWVTWMDRLGIKAAPIASPGGNGGSFAR